MKYEGTKLGEKSTRTYAVLHGMEYCPTCRRLCSFIFPDKSCDFCNPYIGSLLKLPKPQNPKRWAWRTKWAAKMWSQAVTR